MTIRCFAICCLSLGALSFPIDAATIRVPFDQPTIGDGLLTAVWGDTVLVACGTYYEHGLQIGSGVCLTSQDGQPGAVIIDGQDLGRVLACTDADSTTHIAGITVQHGRTSGHGAGLFLERASPTIENCEFIENVSDDDGGGLYAHWSSSPVLSNVVFRRNSARRNGGGLCFDNGYSITLSDVVFEGNFTTGTSGFGGGMCLEGGMRPRVTRASFLANSADFGGGLRLDNSSAAVFTDVVFIGNEASAYGGGVSAIGEFRPTFVRPVFLENRAESGGAIRAVAGAELSVISGTFFRNASLGGTVHCGSRSAANLENCIIAYALEGAAVVCSAWYTGEVKLTCSDLYGNEGGNWTGCIEGQEAENGNFSEDPLFCGDLNPGTPVALAADSPCAPENNPECGLVGAFEVACGFTSVHHLTWGRIKALWRESQ